jgi:hypothetical protein
MKDGFLSEIELVVLSIHLQTYPALASDDIKKSMT